MDAGGQAGRSVLAEISLNGAAVGQEAASAVHLYDRLSFSPQTTDDIVSSAECSSDDEDLEECDSGHAGGMGVSSCACAERGLFPFILSLICHRGVPPPSIMSHGSFKCNLAKKIKQKVV